MHFIVDRVLPLQWWPLQVVSTGQNRTPCMIYGLTASVWRKCRIEFECSYFVRMTGFQFQFCYVIIVKWPHIWVFRTVSDFACQAHFFFYEPTLMLKVFQVRKKLICPPLQSKKLFFRSSLSHLSFFTYKWKIQMVPKSYKCWED